MYINLLSPYKDRYCSHIWYTIIESVSTMQSTAHCLPSSLIATTWIPAFVESWLGTRPWRHPLNNLSQWSLLWILCLWSPTLDSYFEAPPPMWQYLEVGHWKVIRLRWGHEDRIPMMGLVSLQKMEERPRALSLSNMKALQKSDHLKVSNEAFQSLELWKNVHCSSHPANSILI